MLPGKSGEEIIKLLKEKNKDIELNKNNFTVRCNNKDILFTKKEFELFKFFMENENKDK